MRFLDIVAGRLLACTVLRETASNRRTHLSAFMHSVEQNDPACGTPSSARVVHFRFCAGRMAGWMIFRDANLLSAAKDQGDAFPHHETTRP
jgi:hypothetical protein